MLIEDMCSPPHPLRTWFLSPRTASRCQVRRDRCRELALLDPIRYKVYKWCIGCPEVPVVAAASLTLGANVGAAIRAVMNGNATLGLDSRDGRRFGSAASGPTRSLGAAVCPARGACWPPPLQPVPDPLDPGVGGAGRCLRA